MRSLSLAVLAVSSLALAALLALDGALGDPPPRPNPRGPLPSSRSGPVRLLATGDMKARSRVLFSMLDEARAGGVDLVVVNGDLVEQDSAYEYRYVLGLLGAHVPSGVPLYVTVGNHEVWDRNDRCDRADYVRAFGPPQGWFAIRDVLFVALDTGDYTLDDARLAEADAWLLAERPRFAKAVILTHCAPFYGVPLKDKRGWEKTLPQAPIDWSARLRALAEKHRVDLVLGAHYHGHGEARKVNGVTYVVAGGGGATLDGPDELYHHVGVTLAPAGPEIDVVRHDSPNNLEYVRHQVLRNLELETQVLLACILASAIALVLLRVGAREEVA